MECLDCHYECKSEDVYCRHCGILLSRGKKYAINNVFIILCLVGIIFMSILLVIVFIMN